MLKAVDAVLDVLGPAIEGFEASDQRLIDAELKDADGTDNKSKLGANAILGVSLAVAKAAADSADLPLFRYLGGPNAHTLPVPLMNIINGGAHADNGIDVQEFMVLPVGAESFSEALRWGVETYHALKGQLKKSGYATGLGDEGGFAPDIATAREALDFIMEAIRVAGFEPGRDIALGMDVASTEFFKDGVYQYEGKSLSAAELSSYYEGLVADYPLITIEDPLAEDDWDSYVALTESLGKKVQLVGDDLFVTNPERLAKGLSLGVANSILVKVNQIGTLTETLDAVALAQRSGYTAILSPPLRRDRGHDDRRPRGRHGCRPDQDRSPGPLRARREVQPAAPHRGGARRRRGLRGTQRVPALQVTADSATGRLAWRAW